MASQKFSNFSIDYILGDSSHPTSTVDHPTSPRDFPGHVAKLDQLYHCGCGGHGQHSVLTMNLHPSSSSSSSSWAGMYSCCSPASYYHMSLNSHYCGGQQWPLTTPGCDPAEIQSHQTGFQRQRTRARTVFTDNQTQQLERLFAVTDYPSVDARAELARSAGLGEEIVRVWFKNRRARRKRQSTKNSQNQHEESD